VSAAALAKLALERRPAGEFRRARSVVRGNHALLELKTAELAEQPARAANHPCMLLMPLPAWGNKRVKTVAQRTTPL